jgi:hypothetical protein
VANDRGYDHWDHLEFGVSMTTGGSHREPTDDLSDYQLVHTDWAVVTMVYPDGHRESRTFVGPWNDLDDLEDDIQEWWDSEGTP